MTYDMIIGTDLMHEIGMDIIFSKTAMVWDNASVPMQSVDKLDDSWIDSFEQELMFAHDPVTTDVERIQSIIDAKYTKADLKALTEECKIINTDQKEQ